jgi:hypothetical protein
MIRVKGDSSGLLAIGPVVVKIPVPMMLAMTIPTAEMSRNLEGFLFSADCTGQKIVQGPKIEDPFSIQHIFLTGFGSDFTTSSARPSVLRCVQKIRDWPGRGSGR